MPLPVQLAREQFAEVWPEVEELAKWHASEVGDGAVEPRRRFALDAERLTAASAAGALLVYTARRGSKLIGYLTWQPSWDVESRGLLVAFQGAWFVAPGNWGVAHKLFLHSLADMKLLGIRCCFPHHRLAGRGRGLAKFFLRWGAKPMKQEYILWIGD